MDAGRLVARLTRLGLTSYEARAYAALIRRDAFTAAQVARQAELPRQRIYDVLGSLVKKGLASARPGTQVKYTAIAPELAIERLVTTQRDALAELEREAAQIVEALTPEFEAGRAHTDPLEYIEVLRDTAAINRRFTELQHQVQREILVFTKPPYAKPPQENVEGIEVTRTHDARSVYELSVFDDPVTADGVRRFIEAGEQARFVERLPLKLVIIDETIVMFGMEDPVASSEALTIVVVEHPSLAQVLKIAFDAVWDRGLTFDEATPHDVRQRARPA
ncbi:MAG TPA: helix-turn-helix domain-containing protein [Candidatus Limnocylindrales bacterium]|nr:helix-turn-helix domain-containing protein [Candidatus Limnocylindrales bacterium]